MTPTDFAGMERRAHERLSDAVVADFPRDGAVCVRQLLAPGEVALLVVKEPGTRQRTPSHQDQWFLERSLADLPDIEADRGPFPIIGWDVDSGDDVRHAPRPWVTSPPFPGLVDEWPSGAPMQHPPFPRLLG